MCAAKPPSRPTPAPPKSPVEPTRTEVVQDPTARNSLKRKGGILSQTGDAQGGPVAGTQTKLGTV
jgi:hypothetical protein